MNQFRWDDKNIVKWISGSGLGSIYSYHSSVQLRLSRCTCSVELNKVRDAIYLEFGVTTATKGISDLLTSMNRRGTRRKNAQTVAVVLALFDSDGTVVSCLVASPFTRVSSMELHILFATTTREFRGNGLMRRLEYELSKDQNEVIVHATNTARPFWDKLGYKITTVVDPIFNQYVMGNTITLTRADCECNYNAPPELRPPMCLLGTQDYPDNTPGFNLKECPLCSECFSSREHLNVHLDSYFSDQVEVVKEKRRRSDSSVDIDDKRPHIIGNGELPHRMIATNLT